MPIRLNVDDLQGKDPVKTLRNALRAGQTILIEDNRKGMIVPDAWMQVADTVIIGGVCVKSRDGKVGGGLYRGKDDHVTRR